MDSAVHTFHISSDGVCHDGRISIRGRAHLKEDSNRATPAPRHCSLRLDGVLTLSCYARGLHAEEHCQYLLSFSTANILLVHDMTLGDMGM